MTGALVLLAALALTGVLAALHRARDGVVRPREISETSEDLRDLVPGTHGQRATLVQFSSAFCAPCRATKRVLGEVADVVPGVRHLEVDAESNLDLVRRLKILKTPTTLVLDERGREVLRAVGQPKKHAVLAALSTAVAS